MFMVKDKMNKLDVMKFVLYFSSSVKFSQFDKKKIQFKKFKKAFPPGNRGNTTSLPPPSINAHVMIVTLHKAAQLHSMSKSLDECTV